MKKSIIFSVLIVAFLFSCKSQQKATGYTYDDVYSNRDDHAKITSKPKIQNEDLSASHSVVSADSSSKLSSASATSTVDYSNNSYSARIKRFNDKNPGLNYNSEYYNGSSDSTSSSGGSSPNVNLYFGNSWGSLWDPSFSFGFGYGWGDFGFGYPYSWYYPYYWDYPYYYYPYSYWYCDYPYWGGHGHGHHYWDWNDGNHRDRYYGQRRTLTSPDGEKNSRTTAINNNSRVEQLKDTRTPNPGYVNRSGDQTRSGRTDINRVPPDKQRYNYSRSNNQENTRVIRSNQDNKTRSDRNYVQRQAPTPRYSRPGNQQQVNRSDAQNYSSPAYRQPKSSQEYINPRTQQGRPTGVSGNSNRNGNYNNQTSNGRRYSSPSNTGGNSRVFSNPSGNGRIYSTPSRSYSSPGNSGSSRSSGSGYSAPSRSSSAPAHSGGSSGSSSGGGRRR